MDPQSQDGPSPEHAAACFGKHRTGLVTLAFTDLVNSTALIMGGVSCGGRNQSERGGDQYWFFN